MRRALDLEPRLPRAHTTLATLLMHRGVQEQALRSARNAAALDKEDPTVLYNLGLAEWFAGEREPRGPRSPGPPRRSGPCPAMRPPPLRPPGGAGSAAVAEPAAPSFGADGLVCAVAQDEDSGAVLMVAWMDREAWERTLADGFATFFSRSRGRLWRKGETSGNTMRVRACGSTAIATPCC